MGNVALANGDLERGREGRFGILSKEVTQLASLRRQGLSRVNSWGRRHHSGPLSKGLQKQSICDTDFMNTEYV